MDCWILPEWPAVRGTCTEHMALSLQKAPSRARRSLSRCPNAPHYPNSQAPFMASLAPHPEHGIDRPQTTSKILRRPTACFPTALTFREIGRTPNLAESRQSPSSAVIMSMPWLTCSSARSESSTFARERSNPRELSSNFDSR